VILGVAAVALIIATGVVTGVLVTGKPGQAAEAAKPAPAPASQPPPAIQIQVPAIALVAFPKLASAVPAPTPEARAPTAVPTAIPTVVPTAIPTEAPTVSPAQPAAAVPVITLHPPGPEAPAAATPGQQAHNDMVQGLVDRLDVSGVRAAGAASKALVDGHVYRINDVLDRATGLRLVKVDSDHLTFVDAAGVTYVKGF
jgi:hypothetical protein